MGKSRRKVWWVATLCLLWMVWKERNKIAFDNEELSIQRMKNYLFVTIGLDLSCVWMNIYIFSQLFFIGWVINEGG